MVLLDYKPFWCSLRGSGGAGQCGATARAAAELGVGPAGGRLHVELAAGSCLGSALMQKGGCRVWAQIVR